ncbi:stage IV sporulation protein FA [Fontibacillus phaseoli]|uniref:Stage IV sporulation protein FA n=1 Tax=Fontibacillus phaseoli TaxID=1416533 RepID=A0A369BEM1_9BACL|nr:M23 family metallopeptidase [Fontibacillus phaseoli]RCX19871.1 stage IV sporulation protein FA [Fontibacillus phaseoli]
MDVKSNVRKRCEEVIRQLTVGDLAQKGHPSDFDGMPAGKGEGNIGRAGKPMSKPLFPADADEPDPELLWKRGQGRWNGMDVTGNGEDGFSGGSQRSFWTMLFIRTVISTLLFAALWGVEKYEPAWSVPVRAFVAQSLTKEMDFSAAEAWYEETFGGPPSFIPIFKHHEEKGLRVGSGNGFTLPISGRLAAPFALNLKGVEIIPAGDSDRGEQVKSVETGRVLSIANDAFTGRTVIVQHAGGYTSVYGHLDQLSVMKGDWVEGGDLIGSLSAPGESAQPTLYFALKKDDRYIDPADVIPFD